MKWTENDGVLYGDFIIDDGTLYRRLRQTGRAAVLARNLDVRNHPEYLRRIDGMGCELSIPEADYYTLLEIFPELKSRDHATQTAAWRRFMASPASDAYRVTRRRPRAGGANRCVHPVGLRATDKH